MFQRALEALFIRRQQIKRVWPGQTLHLRVNHMLGSPHIAEVRVRSNDKRRRRPHQHVDVAAHWTT
jgi:hypothetical protein